MAQDEEVIARLEWKRIIAFLKSREREGLWSEREWDAIKQDRARIYREVGYEDSDGKGDMNFGEEYAAVLRQVNRSVRRKIGELHPEFVEALDRQVAEKKYHPLPPLPAELEPPGVALKQHRDLLKWMNKKRSQGTIDRDHVYDATEPMMELFAESGVDHGTLDRTTDRALLHGATQLLKRKLLEARPDLAEEIDAIGCGHLNR